MNGFTYSSGPITGGCENEQKNKSKSLRMNSQPKYQKGDLLLAGNGTCCDSNKKTSITGLEGPALCLDVFADKHSFYENMCCYYYIVLVNGVIKSVPERFVLRYNDE